MVAMTPPNNEKHAEIHTALQRARKAQQAWESRLPRERLQVVRRLACVLAERIKEFVDCNPRPNASPAEFIASELLPLADACRYAARVAGRALAPTNHPRRYGAWWMGRVSVQVTRHPWGTVLILAPSNYPLFLPGVQLVQAITAGNAVLVKPAPGCESILHLLQQCLQSAGAPPELVHIIESAPASGQEALRVGVDKVVLTGAVATGQAVVAHALPQLTPCAMELSGCDAVFVTDKADLVRVARCVAYALQLNGGATCIAPRRLFVTPLQLEPLCQLLSEQLSAANPQHWIVPPPIQARIHQAASAAIRAGAQIAIGQLPELAKPQNDPRMSPLVLRNVKPHMAIAQADLFGPVLSILTVADMPAALEADRVCPYALGAAVFGPTSIAEHWGAQIQAGCVVINDAIVPTADPRVPFGGWKHSGWGVTRGWDGLLEMTRLQVRCTRHGNWLPHLNAQQAGDVQTMTGLMQCLHAGSWKLRWQGIKRLVGSASRSRTAQ